MRRGHLRQGGLVMAPGGASGGGHGGGSEHDLLLTRGTGLHQFNQPMLGGTVGPPRRGRHGERTGRNGARIVNREGDGLAQQVGVLQNGVQGGGRCHATKRPHHVPVQGRTGTGIKTGGHRFEAQGLIKGMHIHVHSVPHS